MHSRMRAIARTLRLGVVIAALPLATGCYGGPCADPTMMILINIVIPLLVVGAVIYVVAQD